jgi:hypothetical protein
MAISQAICNSWKVEILKAEHNFTNSTGHTFNLALYLDATASLSASTTVYTNTGEVAAGGNYATRGEPLVNVTPVLDGSTAIIDFQDLTWSSSTITADGALIFNEDHASDAAVCVLDFGSSKQSSNGDFTIQFPAAAAGTAILRIT